MVSEKYRLRCIRPGGRRWPAMLRARNVVALVVFAHGIGYLLWFLPAWVPQLKLGEGKHMLLADLTMSDPVGKVFGLLVLVVLVGFVVSAWGIAIEASWWAPLAIASAIGGL